MKGLSELEKKLFGKTTLSPVEYSINSISEVNLIYDFDCKHDHLIDEK